MTVGLLVKYNHNIELNARDQFSFMSFFGLTKDTYAQLIINNCLNWMQYSMHSAKEYEKYVNTPIFREWWQIIHFQYDKLFLDMLQENEWIDEMDVDEVFKIFCEFHVRWTLPPTLEEVRMMEKQLQQMEGNEEVNEKRKTNEFVFSRN